MSLELLKRAIRERKVINIVHQNNGKPVTLRNLAPFAIGSSKAGNTVLRAYQLGGQTNDAPSPGWALYRVDKMAVEITDKQFNEADSRFRQYKSTDKGMTAIQTSVALTKSTAPTKSTFSKYASGKWKPKRRKR